MGRKRKPEDLWMPPRVYRGKSVFEFRPKSGGTIKLCPLSSSQRRVWNRYNEEVARLEMQEGSFKELISEFLVSTDFHDLATRTQKDYRAYSKRVIPVFGKVQSNHITAPDIRRYMDLRGKQSKTQANREHSFMSKVFSWGYQRGKVTGNPCKGVDKYTESNRDRYITDKEYSAVLEFANPLLFAAMEISYCCAARQGDVLKLSPQQLLEEGIYIKQGKTGKAQIKAWSNRLKKAVELARSQNKIPSIKWIIADEGGQKISGNRLRHWYRQAKEKAAEKHPDLSFDFTFHDIKAKSISDIEGNIHEKQEISGHLTASQVAVYDRKAKVVKTHD